MPAPSIGPEFAVNTSTTGGQLFPTVEATVDGRFAIGWYDGNGADYRLQAFNADGTKLGSESLIAVGASNTIEDRIELAGLLNNELAVVYVDEAIGGGDILYGRYRASTFGLSLQETKNVSTDLFIPSAAAVEQAGPAVAVTPNGALYIGLVHTRADLDLDYAIYTPTDLEEGEGISRGPGNQVHADIAISSLGTVSETWRDEPSGNVMLSFNGVVGAGSNPHIAALSDNAIAVAWQGVAGDVLLRIYEPGANGPRTNVITVDGAGIGSASHVCALQDGRLLVVWQEVFVSGQNSTHLVAGRLYRRDGVPDSAAFEIDQFSFPTAGEPVTGAPRATQLIDGRIVVTYQDGRAINADIKAKILDPRLAAVAIAGTSFNDDHVGTRFDDVFVEGAGHDQVAAGGGSDRVFGGLGNDTLHGEAGDDALHGEAGNDTLNGGAGADILFAGAGVDTLSGGIGGDVFVFRPGDGLDTIADFAVGPGIGDRIVLAQHAGLATFADVLARATEAGGSTILDLGSGDTITLQGVAKASLAADDFILNRFQDVALGLNSFGRSAAGGGWTSYDKYPRTVGDVDGDGRADIVGFGDPGVFVALANGNGTFQNPIFALNSFGFAAAGGGWSSSNQYPRTLGDVNGDGAADIVGFADGGVSVALANGDGTFQSPLFALNSFGFSAAAGGWSSNNQYPRMAADVNGDGRADAVGFGDGGVYVALGNGNGTFQPIMLALNSFGFSPAAGGWESSDKYPRLLGDVNGDGRADVVGFGDPGVFVALGNANGTFQSPIFALNSFGFSAAAGGWASNNQYPRLLGDVNGDGAADIVGFGDTGIYIALSNGDGTFAAPVFDLPSFGPAAGGWLNNDFYPRALADLSADGAADILGFGDDGVFVALAIGSDWV